MYLNIIQIAESFGVAEEVVERWVRDEGLPFTPDRDRMLFDRTQVANWAAARGLAAQAGFLAPTASGVAAGGGVGALLRAGGIWRDVAAADFPRVCEKVVSALPGATPPIRNLMAQRLRAPDGIVIAPVGGGFALPHPSSRIALGRDSGTVALILLREPLPLPEPPPDDVPVTRLFFFVAPSPRAHLDLLGRLSRLLGRGLVRELVLQGAPDEEIFKAVAATENAAGSLVRETAR
ncbi:MAG: PTS sugar transporter subunit IIA [Opitutaceae bacterium]